MSLKHSHTEKRKEIIEKIEDILHIKNVINIILKKTVFELIAIGTGVAGIIYTIEGISENAVIMDTFSVLAALIALLIGSKSLPFLIKHKRLKEKLKED